LNGALPSELLFLTKLTALNIGTLNKFAFQKRSFSELIKRDAPPTENNFLTGSIPDDFDVLSNLVTLSLGKVANRPGQTICLLLTAASHRH